MIFNPFMTNRTVEYARESFEDRLLDGLINFISQNTDMRPSIAYDLGIVLATCAAPEMFIDLLESWGKLKKA